MAGTSTARVLRFQQRQKAGKAVVSVEIDQVAVAALLERMNLLAEHQFDDRVAIAAAIGHLLDHLTGKERP